MNLAVRYIRSHAGDFKIDPNRIGITGGSAGGHLSLMLGTAGRRGRSGVERPCRPHQQPRAGRGLFLSADRLFELRHARLRLAQSRVRKDAFKPPFDFHVWNPDLKIFEVVSEEARVQDRPRNFARLPRT